MQLTDPKGRLHTIALTPGKQFHTHRGHLTHDDLIGMPDGSTVTNTAGVEYLALRPLLSDYVMSMPRGAAVVYPKDAGQIVMMADMFPGAVVVEAGVGSGALSMSLLRAVGESGHVHSFERREDFAEIAKANARDYFGTDHPAWTVTVGDLVEALPPPSSPAASTGSCSTCSPRGSASRSVADALAPGGVLICYVATATQLSKVAEAMRDADTFTEPQAWESLVRGWHLEGLAVRPAAPDARPHRLPGHHPAPGARRHPAAAQAPPRPRLRHRRGCRRAGLDARGHRRAGPVGETGAQSHPFGDRYLPSDLTPAGYRRA